MKSSVVTDAVRMLRKGLGDTQQQFALRLRTALRTVARYETTRPPSGKTLAQLIAIARDSGFIEYAAIFNAALQEELGVTDTYPADNRFTLSNVAMDLRTNTEAEQVAVAALLAVLREREFVKQRKAINAMLKPVATRIRQQLEATRIAVDRCIAIRRRLAGGESLDKIAAEFGTTPRELTAMLRIYELVVDAKVGTKSLDVVRFVRTAHEAGLSSQAIAAALGASEDVVEALLAGK